MLEDMLEDMSEGRLKGEDWGRIGELGDGDYRGWGML